MLLSNSLLSSSPCSPFKLLPNSLLSIFFPAILRGSGTLAIRFWAIWFGISETTYFSIHYHARLPCFNTQHSLLHSKLGMRVWEDLLPNHTGRLTEMIWRRCLLACESESMQWIQTNWNHTYTAQFLYSQLYLLMLGWLPSCSCSVTLSSADSLNSEPE